MRKLLLATVFAGFAAAGAAQAATSPVTVNVGGSTDFIAGNFTQSNRNFDNTLLSNHRDFETVYNFDFSVNGKLNNGIEYGGLLSLTNQQDISNNFSGTQSPFAKTADVFLSSAYGKAQLGDSRGATDLTVGAPSVGEGQATGRYVDFLNTQTFAKNFVYGVDGSDHSTNVTYFTPKFGFDANNKFQLGASYVPQFYNYGTSTVKYNNGGVQGVNGSSNTLSPYKDVYKIAGEYTGNVSSVALAASGNVINGQSSQAGSSTAWDLNAPTGLRAQSFTAYGFGAQAAFEGFTLGGSYTDWDRYNAVIGQNRNQNSYTAGLKYEFSKYAVAANYLGGEGYSNLLGGVGGTTVGNANYVKDFNSYGVGGAYTWAPGLTSNVDGVYFNQSTDVGAANKGYVLLVSQKLVF